MEGGIPGEPGSTCDTTECPPPPELAACCFEDGSCKDLPAEHCLMEGGLPGDPGSTCDTTECP
jgi:hypothetical protein